MKSSALTCNNLVTSTIHIMLHFKRLHIVTLAPGVDNRSVKQALRIELKTNATLNFHLIPLTLHTLYKVKTHKSAGN